MGIHEPKHGKPKSTQDLEDLPPDVRRARRAIHIHTIKVNQARERQGKTQDLVENTEDAEAFASAAREQIAFKQDTLPDDEVDAIADLTSLIRKAGGYKDLEGHPDNKKD